MAQKIKIFYFIPNLAQGGPERQLLELINHLPPQFEPVLCLYHDNIFFTREKPADQPRYILGYEKMGFKGYRKLVDILKKEKPTILHSFRDKSNFWARFAALRAGVPIIISSCRNRMIELRYVLFEKYFSKRQAAILTNSVGVKKELMWKARVSPQKIRVIYNYIDVNFFSPPTREQNETERARWNIKPDEIVFMLPGRVGIQKNQIFLLWALKRLLKKGELPKNFVLLLVGRKRDKVTSWIVDQMLKNDALQKHVRFLDAQKDMLSLYHASDVIIMPSLFEGLSNAALEGVCCGLPGIFSYAVNMDGIIENGKMGFEVPTLSLSGLAGAIKKMCALTPEEREEMGRLGREHVKARFAPTPTFAIEETVKIYQEFLEKNAHAL
ncbi:glycosyltransferase [bacterium]|nr:glycosyltransferase [bacterium]